MPWELSFSALRESIHRQQKLRFQYQDEAGRKTWRKVRPLAMVFFGPVWLLVAWCEKRRGFRNFRLDRMQQVQVLAETFVHDEGKSLQDYLRQYGDCG
jgi:predicted DNA-binding transcriptional regulator YafY